MTRWQTITAVALISFLASGIFFFFMTRPRGTPLELSSAVFSHNIQFEIAGEVHQPGIYESTAGARIAEAVELAGGLKEKADSEKSGLAQLIRDGDTIIIPTKPSTSATLTPPAKNGFTATVNLNTAELEELMTLPGIGEKKAQDIIDYRNENGLFTDFGQLLQIDGFGRKTIERFIEQVTLE